MVRHRIRELPVWLINQHLSHEPDSIEVYEQHLLEEPFELPPYFLIIPEYRESRGVLPPLFLHHSFSKKLL